MTASSMRSRLSVGVLAAVLGFGLAVQVRTTQDDSTFSTARQEDLLGIIDDLSARSERLRAEADDLGSARTRLNSSGDRAAAAADEAKRRADTLAILAGSAAVHGPGVRLLIDDPAHSLRADFHIDVVQELRDAGAEALMINARRVGVSTYFVDAQPQVVMDGTTVTQPYTVVAIGDQATLAEALDIPGGIVDAVQDAGARIRVERLADVTVDALRPLSEPRYARPTQPR